MAISQKPVTLAINQAISQPAGRAGIQIPMSSPDLTEEDRQAVNQVLSTPVLSMGPMLEAFEAAVAAYTGSAYAIGVNSGTSGLHLAVIASGIREGDLVITTPFSFVASANCILYERAIPIFVDVDPLTGNIDPGLVSEAARDLASGSPKAKRWLPPALQVEGAGKSRPRLNAILPVHTHGQSPGHPGLKAILPVHAFGQPADLGPILETAREHGLRVIEDACEALGAEYLGGTPHDRAPHKAGTLGDVAVFAFYPNKQITTGEGGMIVTQNADWARLFRSLRNQGRDEFDEWLNHARLGYNYRLDELSAALGLTQIQRVEQLLARREQVAHWYNERLKDHEFIQIPALAQTTARMSWFVYVIRIHPSINRKELMRQLSLAGIPSRPYFTPIHLQPFYKEKFGYRRGDFPETERLGDTSLALPFSSVMTEAQVETVCNLLRDDRLQSQRQRLAPRSRHVPL